MVWGQKIAWYTAPSPLLVAEITDAADPAEAPLLIRLNTSRNLLSSSSGLFAI